jgi:hypothetical protein
MVDVQTLSIVFAGLSIGIAAIYYALTLRNTRKNQRQTLDTRQTNILMDLYREWGADDYQKASWTVIGLEYESYQEFKKKYGSPSELTEVTNDIYKVGWFYNGLGVLVHRGLADIEMVHELFGYIIIWMWEKVEPFIKWERETFNQPKSMEWFEFLYDKVKPMTDEHPELKT